MLGYLLILFLLLPFVDIFILVELSGTVGFWNTLLLVLFTGIIGAGIVKREGLTVLRKLQRSVTAEEISRNILEGVILALGGLMLLSPGIITDVLGLLCAWQPTREKLMLGLAKKFKDRSNMRFEVQAL